MSNKGEIDIRIIRTRKTIMNSFMELLRDKSFEAIRISDISTKAAINRATFYNHFTDKYHLLDEITNETLLGHMRKNLGEEEPFSPLVIQKIFLVLTNFHTDMADMCKKNYVEDLALYTNQILREEVKNTLLKSIQLKSPGEDPERLETLAAVLSWFVIGISYEWKRTKNISAEAYFKIFRQDYERIILEFDCTESQF